jgi:hypothetical protein
VIFAGRPPASDQELLGQREVDFRADRDVIEVGRAEGRFRKLRVVVRGAPIQLRDMQVIFGDDLIFDPVTESGTPSTKGPGAGTGCDQSLWL